MHKALRSCFIVFSLILVAFFGAKGQNCTVNAGINTTICPGNPFVLKGVVSGEPISGTAVWSQISGPSVTLSATTVTGTAATATVSGYAPDVVYGFKITSKCSDGSLVSQSVEYVASSLKSANAGTNTFACPGTFNLQGSALAPGETGIWTKVSGTGPDPNQSTATSPNGTITFLAKQAAEVATYRWTVSKTTNGNTCSSFSDVIITNLGTQVINAGADINTSCYNIGSRVDLNGSFAGANTPYGQSAKWTFVSGPSVPTFSNIAIRNPNVSNLIQGTYVLRYTVTGPCYSGSDDISIIVAPASQNITSAGGSGTAKVYCDGRTTIELTGPKALYAGESVLWEKVSGSGTQTITNPTSNVTTVTGINGAANSNYEFKYTITNSNTGCTSVGQYLVQFKTTPTISINTVSPAFLTCNTQNTTINYTVAGGTATQYALISAPMGSVRESVMGGLNNYTTAAASGTNLTGFDKIGTYVIRYRRFTENGSGGCADAYAEVRIVVSSSPTSANGGTKQVLGCNVFHTELAGNIPTVGIGKWSQMSGPNAANIVNPLANNTTVNGLTNGTYIFRWVISGGEGACTNTQSDVEVVVSAPSPTTSIAGNAQALCNSTPAYLKGNSPVLNEVGTWTVVKTGGAPAPEVVFTPNINAPNATATGLLGNSSYTFTWTIKNSCGSSTSNVVIATSNTAGPKAADAGIDLCLTGGTASFNLSGNQPTGGETGVWTRMSGPNMPTFTASQYNTTVTGAINGTYVFEWKLSKNACDPTADLVVITIAAATTTANAGVAQNICGTTVTLNGNNPTVGTGTWTQVGGPGGAVITNPSARNTTVTGLTGDRYTFRWTISNDACLSNFADVVINASTLPTPANAGADFAVCNVTSTTLAATPLLVGTGNWAVVKGPTVPVFTDANSPTSAVSNLKYGVYTFSWTSRGGAFCQPSTDEVVVTVTQKADGGGDRALCNVNSVTLAGNENSTGTWTKTSGNAVTLTPVGTNSTIVTGLTPGVYKFNYHLNAIGSCAATDDEIQVTIAAAPSAAIAGPDESKCQPTGINTFEFTMAATVPTVGVGTWKLLDKTAGTTDPVIANANSATTKITGSQPGVYLYEWRVENGSPCNIANANADIVRLTVYKEPSASVAGPNQLAACTDNVVLAATSPVVGIGTWSVASKPAGSPTVTFSAINSPTSSVTNVVTGNYTFIWTVSNGSPICAAKTSVVNVNVTTAPPTAATVGATQNVCNSGFPGTPTTSTTLTGNIPGALESGMWTKVTGPNNPTFSNASSPTTTISNLVQGTYVLKWEIFLTANQTASDCKSFATLTINVYNQPSVAKAGFDQNICLFAPVNLTAETVTSGTGTWSVLSKPLGSSDPVFGDINVANTSLNGLQVGNYTLRWTTTNGTCTGTQDDVNIVVYNCEIAIAKATSTPQLQADGSYNMTLTFKVKNTGNIALSNVQVEDNLLLTFPLPKTWTITSLNTTGALVKNAGFNGNTDKNLLNAASSTLTATAEETITLVINVKLN